MEPSLPTDVQQLAPASISISRTVHFIAATIALILAATAYWFEVPVIDILLMALTLLLLLTGTVLPPLRYRRTHYWLNNQGLYIQRGIWWHKRTLVPRNRIQHSDVAQGPLQRKFHLGTLIVHTAGTTNASVALPGLLHTTAVELRNQLASHTESPDDAV